MIRRLLGQGEPQERADGQRVARAPGNPTFRLDPFEVAEQQQTEVASGLQTRPAHDRRIELAAAAFDKLIEGVGVEQRIQPRVERVARRRRQLRGRDPQRRLLALSGSHRHW